jgi:hypothetical protein
MPLTAEQARALGLPEAGPRLTNEQARALGLPVPEEATSVGEAIVTGLGRAGWALPGLLGLDRARAQALGAKYLPEALGGAPEETRSVAELTQAGRERERKLEREHPILTGLAIGAGSIPETLILPQAKLGEGASLGLRALRSAATFGPQAAAIEGGLTYGQPVEERLGRMALAGITGAGLGALAPQAIPGLVRPPRYAMTPEAQTLERAGVTNLTPGQKAPQTILGNLERMSSQNPLGLEPQRLAAQEQWMRVAQNQGVAPGAQAPTTPDLQLRLRELFQGFDKAYEPLRAKTVDPKAAAESIRAAVKPAEGIPASAAKAVLREVQDAASTLPQGRPTTVGDLLKVRSIIRDNGRLAAKAEDFDKIRLFGQAEDVVTSAIESALDPAERAALQSTDRQYARLMTAVSAPAKGATEFTPLQYLRQVAERSGRRNFLQGQAGDLQDLGEAARVTFNNAPMTGGRVAALSAIPGARTVAAPLARLANSPLGQRFLFAPRTYGSVGGAAPGTVLGTTPALSAWERALLESLGRPRVRIAPAAGEENR